MGMYDEILVADPKDAENFKNAAGVPMYMVELQTKSLDCSMNHYVLHSGQLWKTDKEDEKYEMESGSLVRKTNLVPVTDITATIHVYCADYKTLPVLAFNLASDYNSVQSRYCNCEWTVTIKNGVVIEVSPYKIEARERVLEEVKAKFGEIVILDEHPVAKAYFAKIAKGKRPW